MFRKHILFAAAFLLAATVSIAQASTQDSSCPIMGCNPTCTDNCAVNCCADTTYVSCISTCKHIDSTSKEFAATSEEIFSKNVISFPTGFPQQTDAHHLISSTGHDYTTASVSAQEQKMMNLLNQDRKNNGLSPLPPDEELSRIARIKSADMRDEGYFAHESPTYGNVREMLKRFGYPYAGAGENIAHHANVDKAQAAFMSSPGHRANILSKAWTKMGIGIVLDAQGYIYATQIFAR